MPLSDSQNETRPNSASSQLSDRTDAVEERVGGWLAQIRETIACHRSDLAERGSRWINRIGRPSFDSAKSRFKFDFYSGLPTPVVVSIQFKNDPDQPFQFSPECACAKSSSHLFCEHTYAAYNVLYSEFSDPDSKLLKKVLDAAQPSWAVALRHLDKFLQHSPATAEREQPTIKSRLAWRLIFGQYSTISLEPVEQTPSKRGGWNKGRVIPWDRLHSIHDLGLLPADHEVLRMTGDSRFTYWGPTTDQVGTICEKLIGHPHVYFETIPMNVVRGQLGLLLEEQDQNWKLVPSVDGRSIFDFDHYATCNRICGITVDKEQGQIYVVRADNELWSLAEAIISNTPVIPPQAQPEFLQRLPALEARFPVGLPASLRGEYVPAQNRQVLRLTPAESAGAVIQIQVQPAPDGSYFSPGEGPLEVAGQRGQDRVQVERNHAEERQRADRLSKDLFLNRFRNLETFSWQIPSDDEVLDLLDALRARPENDPVVLWPDGNSSRKMAVLGEVSPSSLRVEIKDHHDWFGLSGSVTLGDQQFPLMGLLSALKGGRRYLDLGKGQFAIISQEFRDRLATLSDMIHSNRGKLEINSTAAPVLSDLFDKEVNLKASKKWKESLKRLQRASDLDPVVPATLAADLRDYQVDGYKWLRRLAEWGVGGCLADDMGLGKTVQAIAVLIDRREVGPTLIAAPVSVGFNWMREVERFAPTLRPVLYRDTDRVEFLKSLKPGDLLITSYHLLQQHISELSTIKWGTLVLDEAQAIKNSQTKTAQAVREIQAEWKLALSGTPAENHLGDLWSLFRAVSPGLFGSWERFREVFAEPIERGKDIKRKQALSRVIRPFILRRTKSEVLSELPARTEIQVTAELSKEERRIYEDARLWAVKNLTNLVETEEKDQRFQVLAALTKLRQLACHPRLVHQSWTGSSAKLDLFLEKVDELRDGRHRALVFSQFTQHLAIVREALDKQQIAYQYLDGSTPARKRQEAVEAFQRGEGEFFLISLKAGGTGLNLTGADYVLHLDPWWNPAVEDQATDRAHRIGQTRPVTVYRLVAKETIEEQILKLHADKRGLVAGILEGTDAAAKMSTAELVDLIKLGGQTN